MITRELLNEPWQKVAARRRILLLIVVLVPSLVATSIMGSLLPHQGSTTLELAIIIVYGILFIWISLGFWTALAGFWTLLKKYDKFAVSHAHPDQDAPIRSQIKTAILFPICNEDPQRIIAGIFAVWRSLQRLEATEHFDIHILSDSPDPDRWVQEEAAWNHLCTNLAAHGQIFYRRRRINLKRKSGNVADFCRRYGAHYTYMIVFDADSVMSGETLVHMVQIMERKRNVGILQTAPACTGRETFIARAQQFANRAYGPMYAAGLHHWFLGDAQFWGHNAIIRVKPFMEHCALSRLPGKPPLGGDILSHDFVESALMRRAGYSVWLAYDLEGSYEEVPPTLLSELKRDRRWCQGNLQHLRLVFTRGIFPGHRVLFLNGVMSYGSALLWFLFLSLATAEALVEALVQPDYFTPDKTLFPIWPVWDPRPGISLLVGTALILFLPKVCAFFLILIKGRRKQFGGFFALWGSIFFEVIFSTLLAPVRMLFHSKYVFLTLLGMGIGWNTQQRDDSSTSFGEAVRFHGTGTLLGLVWGLVLFQVNRVFFWWASPLILSLAVSIPISMITSTMGLGRFFAKLRIFTTPEERTLPKEYKDIQCYLDSQQDPCPFDLDQEDGFARAVVDPRINALHLTLLGQQPRSLDTNIALRRDTLVAKALALGPDGLSKKEKKELLYDPERMARLHEKIWNLSEENLLSIWKVRLQA